MSFRKICLLSAILVAALPARAQLLHDAVWLFGNKRLTDNPIYGGSIVDFRNGAPDTSSFDFVESIDLDPTAAMSDAEGNLLFYTNGCSVFNAEHAIMEGGAVINAGVRHGQYCVSAYPSPQGVIAMPRPGVDGRYGLFHTFLADVGAFWTKLLYSEIDCTANGGSGRVDAVDQVILTDTLAPCITATRHANGRDWWVLVRRQYQSGYYVVRYGSDGVEAEPLQVMPPIAGISDTVFTYWMAFSPDGASLAVTAPEVGIYLFDFDRCSGLLSNQRMLSADIAPYAIGVAFSPNSRYLYVAAVEYMYQYDVEAPDVSASRQTVAVFDGHYILDAQQLVTTFGSLMLAPDGKIYGGTGASAWELHIIHHPDRPGLACEVEQHGLRIPHLHGFAPPNFAYYNLWDLPGSPCDTLGIDAPVVSTDAPDPPDWAWQVSPNPSSGGAVVAFPSKVSGRLHVLDMAGRLVAQWQLEQADSFSITGLALAAGMYIIRLEHQDGWVRHQKWLVQYP